MSKAIAIAAIWLAAALFGIILAVTHSPLLENTDLIKSGGGLLIGSTFIVALFL